MNSKVQVKKVNSGIVFTLLSAPKKAKPNVVLSNAFYMFFDRANKNLQEAELRELSYDLRYERVSDISIFLGLEPWGFAEVDNDGNVVMGNSGSTPTEARAKRLWAYQMACGIYEL